MSAPTAAPSIELTTLSDGGQRPGDIARGIAGFLSGAADPRHRGLRRPLRDGRRRARARRAAAAAVQRGVRVRLLYNVAHPGPIPVPPRRRPRPTRSSAAGGDARHRGRPRPHAPQVRRPRRSVGLDRLDELDGRLLVAAGERHRHARRARRSPTRTRSPSSSCGRAGRSSTRATSSRARRTSTARGFAPGSAPSTESRCRTGSRSTSARRGSASGSRPRCSPRADPGDARRGRAGGSLRPRRRRRRHAGRPGVPGGARTRSASGRSAPPHGDRGRALERQGLDPVDAGVGARLHARESRRRRRHVLRRELQPLPLGRAERGERRRDPGRSVADRLATYIDEVRARYPRATAPGRRGRAARPAPDPT